MSKIFHPLVDGGNLIAASVDDVLERAITFVTQNRLPKRDPQLSRYEVVPDVAHDLVQSLEFLVPLVNNMITRYLLIETTDPNWSVLLHNHAGTRVDLALVRYLTEAFRTRGISWSCREHTLKMRRGELSGHPGGANFCTFEDGKLVRSIDCVYEGKTWRFAQFGTPYDFEAVERYVAPNKRDRLTCEMVRDYLHAFGVFPEEEEDFYEVTTDHPARGIKFVSDDPTINAWLDPAPLDAVKI